AGWGQDETYLAHSPRVCGTSADLLFHQTEVCTFAQLTAADGPYRHRIEQQELTAKVMAITGSLVRVRLNGSVRIKHRFYPGRDDQNVAQASVVGYMEIDAAKKTFRSIRLVTDHARYSGQPYSVAGQMMP